MYHCKQFFLLLHNIQTYQISMKDSDHNAFYWN